MLLWFVIFYKILFFLFFPNFYIILHSSFLLALGSNFSSILIILIVFVFGFRYKKLLSSVDLTKDFFYSYTYPIMQSLQKNVLSMGEEGMPYDNIFVWNAHLTQAIQSRCSNTIWTIALVHGHFKQVLQMLTASLFIYWTGHILPICFL